MSCVNIDINFNFAIKLFGLFLAFATSTHLHFSIPVRLSRPFFTASQPLLVPLPRPSNKSSKRRPSIQSQESTNNAALLVLLILCLIVLGALRYRL